VAAQYGEEVQPQVAETVGSAVILIGVVIVAILGANYIEKRYIH